jgi:hypothetical protein
MEGSRFLELPVEVRCFQLPGETCRLLAGEDGGKRLVLDQSPDLPRGAAALLSQPGGGNGGAVEVQT